MKKFLSFMLAFTMIFTMVVSILPPLDLSAASFESGPSYTEEEIKQMRDEANTYEKMFEPVNTVIFDWLHIEKMVFLNAPEGASGFGHSAILLIDKDSNGVFFSYYPSEEGFFESLLTEGEVRMKYLSSKDIQNFWITGSIVDAVTSTNADKIVLDGGYERGIVKKPNDGEAIYRKMLSLFADPGTYMLFGHQCDDTALSLFCETNLEFAIIWGDTFANPFPNVTYNHLVKHTILDNRYSILADFLVSNRTTQKATIPDERGNEDALAFAMYGVSDIDFPSEIALSSQGVMPDGRLYRKYYFQDKDVFLHENAIISTGDLSTRYLVCVGDAIIEEMYLLFSKTGNEVNGGNHDEIYKKVVLGHTAIRIEDIDNLAVGLKDLVEFINGVPFVYTYTLNYDGASMASILCNVLTPQHNFPSESKIDDYLYWDSSNGAFLTQEQWRDEIHYSQRFTYNQDDLLPKNVVEALQQGFEKLPRSEAEYHQIDKSLDEYEYGACLKFVHEDGREAIYIINTNSLDYENDISKYPASTTLITIESHPEIGPTFNYAPNDSAGTKWFWETVENEYSYLESKFTTNSIAHYYFDMLTYYWWGNTPDAPIHVHEIEIDEAVPSTCKTYGLTEGSHCSDCGEIITSQRFEMLAAHDYNNGICRVCGKEEVIRYTVLVLDTSSTSRFSVNGVTIYEADTAIKYVKEAAKTFADNLAKDDAKNYIAVISYKSTASIVSDFTSNVESVKSKISNLSTSSNTRDISAGLKKANELLSEIEDENAIKNVVLCTTGMTNHGSYDYNGDYDENTVGSNWYRTSTGVYLYAYANAALTEANKVKENANLYVLGLFQTMNEMPEEGKDVVDLFRLTAKDIAGSEEYFYDIVDTDNISFKFGEVADDIIDKDTDGDGLFDSWELYGVDTDNDGVVDLRLDLMGADPNVPDIFVEVDWMVAPEENLLFITTQQEQSLAPSAASMYMVYEAFKKQGINLHIDAGPSSIDYVTGNPWGALSGGNKIAYVECLNLNGDERGSFNGWEEYINTHFSVDRRNVFKYCMFINQYECEFFDENESVWKTSDKKSSGIAASIPGQYFIVANQKWVRDTGNIGVAGTFMHELGHTLGLTHGGFDDEGNPNDDQYKPNYLSVMNYLFQMTGLVGTGKLDYSQYDLPDLDENALFEEIGIDPEGITADTGLGSTICMFKLGVMVVKNVIPIAKQSIDFNSLWGIESKEIQFDLNHDDEFTVLTSSTDWDHLIYTGGDVGSKKQIVNIQGIASPLEIMQANEVLTLEKALETGSLAQPGTVALEALGPYDLFTDHKTQNAYVRVLNLSNTEAVVTLTIGTSAVTKAQTLKIMIPASVGDISYVDVKIPIVGSDTEGSYLVHVSAISEQQESDIYLPINFKSVTTDDLTALQQTIDELEEELPYTLLTEYKTALDDCAIKGHIPNEDDGDCTTEITCSVCGMVTTEAAEAHIPNEDDGDCTTEITCSVCGTVTTEAQPNPTPDEPNDGNFIDSIAGMVGLTSMQLILIAVAVVIVIAGIAFIKYYWF